ncbi:hypothetical protein Dsin_001081 [Dipteronia sinensis]|uniref:DUF4283 domain-containing protein n=1 Tax=Dipteronia sinensis TaxID=43782 RepID=A0AAE0B4J9_9ROSI|nr:hypothetical protein Dsin_001081 [Dipteronia sinensis]
MEIEVIKDNLFAFYFKNQMDKRKVLTKRLWSFDKSMVVLEEPTREGDIDRSLVEDVVDIDMGSFSDYLGKHLRVRFMISVRKPLKRCLRVDLTGIGKEMIVMLRYEWLPDHCSSLAC